MNARIALRAALAAALLFTTAAQAQLFRSYLASDGNDANPCTLQAPCRLLPAALNAVASGGEVWMLDSANYNTGTVTVNKSVSILAVPGVVGSILAIGGPAISISTASVSVSLRNVVISPLAGGAGTNGVVTAAPSVGVVIDNCLIANLPGSAVSISGFGSNVRIINSTVRNNGQWGLTLLSEETRGGIAKSQLVGNGAGGVRVTNNVGGSISHISVSDSLISGGNEGVRAMAEADGASTRVAITRSTIDRTGTAMVSQGINNGTATVMVNSSTIANNTSAWNISGANALIRTLQNNHIIENGGSVGVLTLNSLM